MARTTKTKPIAEICLYGTSVTGAGWLARTADGAMLGDGVPRPDRSFTEAVWLACDQLLRVLGACGDRPRKATVRVFAPGGQHMADVDIHHPGYFGDLPWQAATAFLISAEAIKAAAI